MDEKKNVQGLIDLGKLVLSFAKVNRVTMHEDGVRYESDTDHTVMLSLCACSLASKLYSEKLDIGLVAQFAIVHDIVEVYANDTNSINLGSEEKGEKDEREAESLARIISGFQNVYPWLPETIVRYESKSTPEARFVKTLDKVMTRITNIHNKGAALRALGTTREEITHHFEKQFAVYKQLCGEEFPELFTITEELNRIMLNEIDVKVKSI